MKMRAAAASGRTQQRISTAVQLVATEEHRANLLNTAIPAVGQAAAAEFLSGGGSGGAWLQASPAFDPNRLNDGQFTTALALRLRVPFLAQEMTCAKCGHTGDRLGRHALRCGASSGYGNTRHKWTNRAVNAAVTSAGFTSLAEKSYDFHGIPRKPDGKDPGKIHRCDIYIIQPDGNNVVIDTTVGYPLAGLAHEQRGASAADNEKFKVKHITERYTISEAVIIPFAAESFGVLGAKANAFLRFLAKNKHGEHNKAGYAQFIAYSRARIAVAVQRGNALLIDRWRAECAKAAGGGA